MSYRETIARQPDMLGHVIATVSPRLDAIDMSAMINGVTAVTGIGASYEAAVVTAGDLAARGRRAVAPRAAELMSKQPLYDAIVAISAGGRSIEPVTAIKTSPHTTSYALSRESGNPLADASNFHVPFDSGADATPSSTGYTGSLAAAGLLADRVCANGSTQWEKLPDLAHNVLAHCATRMAHVSALFHDRRAIDCVGSRAGLGTAGGAALLIREASRIPAAAHDTLHYLHGPMEAMDSSTGAVIFGNGREIKLAEDMAEFGCPVVLVTTSSEPSENQNLCILRVPEAGGIVAQGILDILPAQLLAAELSDAASLTDVKFRYRQSDTKIKSEDAS